MPTPEPGPRRTWSLSQRGGPVPKPAEEADLFSLAAPDSGGYEQWQVEKEARRQEFEQAWGIRLGRKVRVQLRHERVAREGVIQLQDELPDPAESGQRQAVRLRIGKHSFLPTQIESLAVLD